MSTDELSETTCDFQTKDLNQAAFVWCQDGAELLRLDGGGSSRTIYFVFKVKLDERDLAALIISYANKKTSVEPQEFCLRQSNLRDLLHGSRRRYANNEKDKGVKTNE